MLIGINMFKKNQICFDMLYDDIGFFFFFLFLRYFLRREKRTNRLKTYINF